MLRTTLNMTRIILFGLIPLLLASVSAWAETDCQKLGPADCFENHLKECILVSRKGADGVGLEYSCRSPRNYCEKNWRHTIWDYKNSKDLKKFRAECMGLKDCKFREPGCVCPGDLRDSPDYGMDCECGGGLPAGCIKSD